jgi:PEP-CTERM motif-containing protein
MTRLTPFVLGVSIFSLVSTTQALADPVSITSGFLVATSPVEVAPVSVVGTSRFSVRGITDPGEGHLDAFSDCRPCMPGDPIRLGGFLSAFNAAATLGGNNYNLTIDINNPVGMTWTLTAGTITAPPFSLASRLLEAPFTLSGRFLPDTQSSGIPLVGRGVASILLSPALPGSNAPPLWQVNVLHYDFQGALAATPEPTSLTLIAMGLAAAGAWRVRQRRL